MQQAQIADCSTSKVQIEIELEWRGTRRSNIIIIFLNLHQCCKQSALLCLLLALQKGDMRLALSERVTHFIPYPACLYFLPYIFFLFFCMNRIYLHLCLDHGNFKHISKYRDQEEG